MSVTLLMTGRRRAGQTLAAHRHHMRAVHGRMVLDYIAAMPNSAPRRYVQNHVLDARMGEGAPCRDFVTELGFPDTAAIAASRQTDFYRDHLMPDEPNMVDPQSVTAVVTRELQGLTGPQTGFKVILLHRALAGLHRADFEKVWATARTEWPRSRSVILGPGPFDGVDAVRMPSMQAAMDFVAGAGQHWLNHLCAAGLTAKDGTDVLIAQEFVMFEGSDATPTKGYMA